MQYFTQKEIEQRHYTTLKNVFITIILLILLVLFTAVLLIKNGYNPELALFESFHLITHFPKFAAGNIWISLLSIVGAMLGFFIIITLLSIVYGGGLKYELKEGRKMSKISQIKNHVIICGANIVGNNLAVKLDADNVQFIIVDNDLKGLAEPRSKSFLVLEGNPLEEAVLNAAKIGAASVFVAAMEEEGSNLLLASMAKKLNPKVKVIAKTNHFQYVEHMEKMGADLVMMPEVLGAFKIADVVKDILAIDKKK
jgi:voltage-gated potassium channel